jgi:hypothetical protein
MNHIVDQNGNEYWKNENNQFHCEDGPAKLYVTGRNEYWLHDKLHRINGPAIIRADGTQLWFNNGRRYRIDGPAILWFNGTQEWIINDINITTDIFIFQAKYYIIYPWMFNEQISIILNTRKTEILTDILKIIKQYQNVNIAIPFIYMH